MSSREGREHELRRRLAKAFGEDDVEEAIWRYLVEQDYVDDALGIDSGWDALVTEYRRLRQVIRAVRGHAPHPGRPVRQEEYVPTLTMYEEWRTRAFEQAAANYAAETPPVKGFRSKVLDGRLLDEKTAWRFVATPTLGFFTYEVFIEHQIPFMAERIHVRHFEITHGGKRWSFHLDVDPPGVGFTVSILEPQEVGGHKTVAARRADGSWDEFKVWPHSVLGWLSAIGLYLTDECPWDERDAVWFVLTGKLPTVHPIRTERMRYWWRHDQFFRRTVTLTVEPWVSADTVLKAYRWLQQASLGGDNRPISTRNLLVLVFVLERVAAEGKRPPWRELMDAWNVAHPSENMRYSNPERFARDFKRAEKAVLRPGSLMAEVGTDKAEEGN